MWVAAALLGCLTPKYVETTEKEEPCEESTWYRDDDGDGYGDSAFATEACEEPAGWVALGDDCDDDDEQYFEQCPGEDCAFLEEFVPSNSEDTADDDDELTRSYYACTEPMGWQDARQRCFNAFSGDLLNMGVEGEFEVVIDAAHRMGLGEQEGWWVGLKQESTAPSIDFGWFWVGTEGWPPNGDLNNGGIWLPGDPDNAGIEENQGGASDEDVAALAFREERWGVVDLHAEQELPYLCEVVED